MNGRVGIKRNGIRMMCRVRVPVLAALVMAAGCSGWNEQSTPELLCDLPSPHRCTSPGCVNYELSVCERDQVGERTRKQGIPGATINQCVRDALALGDGDQGVDEVLSAQTGCATKAFAP